MNKTLRKFVTAILVFAVTIGIVPTALAASEVTAVPSKQAFYLDNEPVEIAAYSINGSNYVKLRDICRLLDYRIEVSSFDEKNNCYYIKINTNEVYEWQTPGYDASQDTNANEPMPTKNATAKPITLSINFWTSFTAGGYSLNYNGKILDGYNINGNNYIPLKEFAKRMYYAKDGYTVEHQKETMAGSF